MPLTEFIDKLSNEPDAVNFSETMEIIDTLYSFTPSAFSNGDLINGAGENSGSCKIFAFGQINGLTEQQTLACFGEYYRNDVLKHPDASDHQNIRNFIKSGWAGIKFDKPALTPLS